MEVNPVNARLLAGFFEELLVRAKNLVIPVEAITIKDWIEDSVGMVAAEL